MWIKIPLIILIALAALIAAGIAIGSWRWKSGTQELRSQLQTGRLPLQPTVYDPRELEGLPEPVQRYFHAVLQEGQPLISAASLRQYGQFNLSQSGENWRSFTSTQRVITQKPGFDWDARIAMAPGFRIFVHDAYIRGQGILTVSLFGLFPILNLRDTPQVAQGELLRFFAEAAWYPTALLPSQGVTWEAIDDSTARATLQDGKTRVSLAFSFDNENLIRSVIAEERYRLVDGKSIPTPWQGRFWGYEQRHGVRVPMQGEVAWVLDEGLLAYWRGHIAELNYEFTQ